MRLRALVLTAGLLWPVSVFSEDFAPALFFLSGNQVFKICSDSSIITNRFQCTGYVEGLMDGAVVTNMVCPPAPIEADQAKDIMMQYLTAHPERRHMDGAGLALLALQAAFPCK